MRRSPLRFVRRALFLAALAGAAVAVWRFPEEIRALWNAITRDHGKRAVPPTPDSPAPAAPWDGLLRLTESSRLKLGVETAAAVPQSEPIRLELLGTTEYIADTLTKIRPMFKGRVDKVHVTVGHPVKKGDPLIDFYSTELAAAKSAYEIERIQWLYDKKLLEIRESLLQTKTVSQQLYEETKNNEMKERREYEVARDKLLVYGLTEEDVEQVPNETGSQKARLTLRSPADGLVIDRDVAVGNLYDENDTLLVIAPLDRLWVWGNVFERDLNLVELGQAWEIHFPFLAQTIRGQVEYVSNRVDPSTHAVRVRTSIPNEGGKLKANMLVRGMLEIPPRPGRTVIPRTAVVVGPGRFHVFVESADHSGVFQRRQVSLAYEKDNLAVIEEGLKPGESVVTVGALILAQMYEDLETVSSASPGLH